MYNKNTIYVVGNSKTNTDNAITNRFSSFFIGFVVDIDTGEIIDLSCSSTIRTTDDFIKTLLMGKSLKIFDCNLEEEVKRRYHGSSQRAIVVAYKDAVKKYDEVKLRQF
ncbi:DUF3870 domain-containing protein [Clostridium bowmanii]|uniref:DUF3870 domain-containing protein n=1 Tax=Clostridium bowmanii TaxID=132925 RepID=UPI001C0C0DD2|nr:DUF3870 domain-containing protein [Clostridium bowmanii]MBU3188085.1 DUF3870 domain-containing protein [Clostridium bowmanii]MCA1072266.1 DUF3870 domain-containing protein [Clostridium bowmanii]